MAVVSHRPSTEGGRICQDQVFVCASVSLEQRHASLKTGLSPVPYFGAVVVQVVKESIQIMVISASALFDCLDLCDPVMESCQQLSSHACCLWQCQPDSKATLTYLKGIFEQLLQQTVHF